MKTSELIAILSQDPVPRKPRLTIEILGALLIVLCGLVTKFWLGLRPELNTMSVPTSFWFKTLTLGSLIILSVQALKASSVPLGRYKLRYFAIAFAVVFTGALLHEWMTKPVEQIQHLFLLPNFTDCLIYSTLFGSAVSLALLAQMKHAAPPNLGRTAGCIGLAAGCIGGLGYSIHCPIDSPTFIAIGYGVPQLTLYLVSRVLFVRFLRW